MIKNIITIARDTESLWRLYEKQSRKLEKEIQNILPNTLSDLIDGVYINIDYEDEIFIDIDCDKRYSDEMIKWLDETFPDIWVQHQEGDYGNNFWIYINDKFYKQLEAIQ